MSALYIVLCLIIIASCIITNTLILMQQKRSSGLSGNISGMGAGQPTYWDKNKGRSFEGLLEKYTKIFGAAFIIISLATNLVR